MPSTKGHQTGNLRRRIVSIYLLLLGLNIAAWIWAVVVFHHYPVLLGTALLAYSFGLRHAVDADHIAAIDNVTRKLMQQGQRPVGVGFYFSLGHSTIVVLASAGVAATAAAFADRFSTLQRVGGLIGTSVSALFLLLIAILNFVILCETFKTFRRVKSGEPLSEESLSPSMGGGLMTRIFVPLFKIISKSWHMYFLGFLFGLGFDTATEVGLLGISAASAGRGMPIWSIMVFPALFTAGMSLVDTTDGILMLGAYGWAFIKPVRKLYYNLTITFVSVVVALAVGAVEVLGMVCDQLQTPDRLQGRFWSGISSLNDHFGAIGFFIIALFVLSWVVAAIIYRINGYDTLEIEGSGVSQK